MKNAKPFSFYLSIVLCIVVIFLTTMVLYLNSKQNPLQKTINKYFPSAVEIIVSDSNGNKAYGSGLVLDNTHIISAAHMFETANSVSVKFYDETTFPATVLKIDTEIDLALLEFSCLDKTFPKIDFTTKQSIQFGEEIVKFGNALNYGLSVDQGIISNPYKRIEIGETLRELVQISIDICGGDSGGAVFNNKGQLIGIISFKTSSAIATDRELSFAVPGWIVADFVQN